MPACDYFLELVPRLPKARRCNEIAHESLNQPIVTASLDIIFKGYLYTPNYECQLLN